MGRQEGEAGRGGRKGKGEVGRREGEGGSGDAGVGRQDRWRGEVGRPVRGGQSAVQMSVALHTKCIH